MNHMKLQRITLACLPAILLAACTLALAGRNEPVHTYVLGLDSTDGPPVAGRACAAALLVNVPQASSGFDTPRMVYLLRPHETSHYATSQWADTPARMLAPLLVQAVERTGAWQAVARIPSTIQGDYRLDSEDLVLAQEFFPQPSRVRLTLRVQLVGLRDQRIIGTHAFEVLEEAPSHDAYGGVVAANRAVTTLLERIAAWLRERLHEREGRDC